MPAEPTPAYEAPPLPDVDLLMSNEPLSTEEVGLLAPGETTPEPEKRKPGRPKKTETAKAAEKDKPAEKKAESDEDGDPDEEEEPEKVEETDPDEEEDYSQKAKPKGEIDLDTAPETVARKMAKENGRRAKELETKLTEKDLEFKRIESELEEAKGKLKSFESVSIDYRSHPDFKKIESDIWDNVEDFTDRLGLDEGVMKQKFGAYVGEYMKLKALTGAEKTAARAAFNKRIIGDFGNFDSPYEDLFDDDKAKADRLISGIVEVVQNNVGKTRQLQDLAEEIQSKAKTGQLSQGVEEYTRKAGEISKVLSAFESLSDEVIEADPHSLDSVVAKMIKENPAEKRRFQNVQRDITEAFVGPRALTQKELDDLEATGKDLKTFQKERVKQAEGKRNKLVSYLAQALMTTAENKEIRQKYAELKERYEAEESELEAIDQIKPKKTSEKREEFKGKAKDRPLPTDLLYAGD